MSHIIVLLREAFLAVHDRRMTKKVDAVRYSLLEYAISFCVSFALAIEEDEGERSNSK